MPFKQKSKEFESRCLKRRIFYRSLRLRSSQLPQEWQWYHLSQLHIDIHIDAKVQHGCNFLPWRHSVVSRMAFETEAKSSDAQAPIMERLFEINPQRVWHVEVGHRVPTNHECSPDTRQFQYHIYDHNRVPEIVHGSTHDDNLRSAIVE